MRVCYGQWLSGPDEAHKESNHAPTADDLHGVYDQIASSICRGDNTPPSITGQSSYCAKLASSGTATITLSQTVNDDGKPATGSLKLLWTVAVRPVDRPDQPPPSPPVLPVTVLLMLKARLPPAFISPRLELLATAHCQ